MDAENESFANFFFPWTIKPIENMYDLILMISYLITILNPKHPVPRDEEFKCTAKRKLERLQFSTSSSFVKI